MSLFALSAIGGTALGPVAGGWIQSNSHLQWRWIQWFHAMYVNLSCYHFRDLLSLSEDPELCCLR